MDRVTHSTVSASSVQPVRGSDVRLSLDIQLQARIEALMSHDKRIGLMRRQPWHYKGIPDEVLGDPLNGAAVVMDVATGEIRAAVTVPGVSRKGMRENYQALASDTQNKPFWNRPVQLPLQPGSTVRPLVLAAAVAEGKFKQTSTITCKGMLDTSKPNQMRCWIYKTAGGRHNALTGPLGIMHSCNVFFFTLGGRLGPDLLVEKWYRKFGLGERGDCGLYGEADGLLPAVADLRVQDARLMAIGQGSITWTPIQTAAAYATIARKGGSLVRPTFLADAPDRSPSDGSNLNIRLGATMALKGLYKAANDKHGTVHHLSMLPDRPPIFDIEDIDVFAKSGTAHTGRKWTDSQGIAHDIDHAWTVCLAQRPDSLRPDFVIVVVVEEGGSGGAVAGPIVNQILHEMRAEDYL